MNTLVLIRHGQSQWNLENRFTGWTDVPVTEQGKKDAAISAGTLKGMTFDLAFTSRLQRAQQTLDIVLKELGQSNIPVEKDSALNERHYGDLQGLNKSETAEKYGMDQVKLWRRSYDTPPPNGESIQDCVKRVTPYFIQYIWPHIEAGKNVIIAAHGNSLRPIMRYLEKLDDEETASREITLVTPYLYIFEKGKLVKKEVKEVPGIITSGGAPGQKKA